jgi:four helix bundle protein
MIMSNIKFARELENRTKNFSVSIIRYLTYLPKSTEHDIIKSQLIKSATSIGANYREANRSRSKADFIGRLRICQSEASETLYWLEILHEIASNNTESDSLLKESKELLALFTSIIVKLRRKTG